jgi:hypothetical protein
MVVNFRVREISRGVFKLTRTHILIKKNKKKFDVDLDIEKKKLENKIKRGVEWRVGSERHRVIYGK